MVATPTPAHAATGGGCSSVTVVSNVGTDKACISTPGSGKAVATGYLNLYAGHPYCQYQENIWNGSNMRVATTGKRPCPKTSAATPVTYITNMGALRASIEVFYSGTSRQTYSPVIVMP